MAKKVKSKAKVEVKPNYDEIFPDENMDDAVGVSTVLTKGEPKEEPEEVLKEEPKEEKPKKNPSLELYKDIENLRSSIGMAIDKGNTTSIWKVFEDILKRYKKIHL